MRRKSAATPGEPKCTWVLSDRNKISAGEVVLRKQQFHLRQHQAISKLSLSEHGVAESARHNSRFPCNAEVFADVGEVSVGVRKSEREPGRGSEAVALGDPVMPVGDGFGGGLVHVDPGQLG